MKFHVILLYVKWIKRLMEIKQNSYLTTNKKSTFLYALLVR
ncbi:hypothetical protein bcere0026_52800 [Bacillus mycoides]|uniref:Uncharacterized protein n=1 Tax=Bacillus mycoides TaxID=1405 RepID=C2Y2T3_BACMY|nr:hypothetical protein bcere0026_52800 [Bacillus mycoides]